MKTLTMAIAAAVAMTLTTGAWAAEATTATAAKATTATVDAGKATTAAKDAGVATVKEVGNAKCPISGQPVGSMQKGSHVDYKGYRVGLCCDSCKQAFLKDADANLAKAKAEAGKK